MVRIACRTHCGSCLVFSQQPSTEDSQGPQHERQIGQMQVPAPPSSGPAIDRRVLVRVPGSSVVQTLVLAGSVRWRLVCLSRRGFFDVVEFAGRAGRAESWSTLKACHPWEGPARSQLQDVFLEKSARQHLGLLSCHNPLDLYRVQVEIWLL